MNIRAHIAIFFISLLAAFVAIPAVMTYTGGTLEISVYFNTPEEEVKVYELVLSGEYEHLDPKEFPVLDSYLKSKFDSSYLSARYSSPLQTILVPPPKS